VADGCCATIGDPRLADSGGRTRDGHFEFQSLEVMAPLDSGAVGIVLCVSNRLPHSLNPEGHSEKVAQLVSGSPFVLTLHRWRW
jgi:hypothetical protein